MPSQELLVLAKGWRISWQQPVIFKVCPCWRIYRLQGSSQSETEKLLVVLSSGPRGIRSFVVAKMHVWEKHRPLQQLSGWWGFPLQDGLKEESLLVALSALVEQVFQKWD